MGAVLSLLAVFSRRSWARLAVIAEAVAPHRDRITAWLDSFRGNPMSGEAAAVMYLQLAIEEMPPSWPGQGLVGPTPVDARR